MVETRLYMAPERYFGQYSYASDVWSMGLTVHELAGGLNTFSGCSSDAEFWQKVYHNPVALLNLPTLDDFVARCLEKDPEDRAKTTELLQHMFVCTHLDEEETCDAGQPLSPFDERRHGDNNLNNAPVRAVPCGIGFD